MGFGPQPSGAIRVQVPSGSFNVADVGSFRVREDVEPGHDWLGDPVIEAGPRKAQPQKGRKPLSVNSIRDPAEQRKIIFDG